MNHEYNGHFNKKTLAYNKEWTFMCKAIPRLGLCQPNAYSVWYFHTVMASPSTKTCRYNSAQRAEKVACCDISQHFSNPVEFSDVMFHISLRVITAEFHLLMSELNKAMSFQRQRTRMVRNVSKTGWIEAVTISLKRPVTTKLTRCNITIIQQIIMSDKPCRRWS